MTKVQKLKGRGVRLSDFSIGRPDFDTPKHIKEATKKVIDKGLVHYTSSAGVLEPKEAVCYHLQKDYRINIYLML